MLFRGLIATIGVAGTLVFATPGSAAPMLDQSFDAVAAGADSAVNINTSFSRTQTFTAGIAGQLTGMDLQVRRSGSMTPTNDLVFDILPTPGGVPSGPTLGSGAIAAGSVPILADFSDPTFVFVDLSALNIFVEVGDVLAIALNHLNDGRYLWFNTPGGDLYAGGSEFVTVLPDPTQILLSNSDLGFRTFVDPDPATRVPEPASLAMLTLGLTMLGFARRKGLGKRG